MGRADSSSHHIKLGTKSFSERQTPRPRRSSQGGQQIVATNPFVQIQMPQLLPSNRSDSPSGQSESEDHFCRTFRIIVARSVRLRLFIQQTEYDQKVIIRFLCKERVSPQDIHARLEAQFGDATYSERSVRLWSQYVRQGREDLHNEARSGGPPIDFLDIRILALPDERPFHLAYSIAESLYVSHSTILSHLRKSLRLKRFHLRWIPHE
jgi:hypothetical protein